MVKQTKTFKKGNVTKKALSAILAASMVMTSSSFVMAAPVEVEAVDVVEDVNAGEEQVGVGSIVLGGITMANNVIVKGSDATVQAAFTTMFNDSTVTRDINAAKDYLAIVDYVTTPNDWTVTVTGPNNFKKRLTNADDIASLPVAAGTYTITVEGTDALKQSYKVTGSAVGTYTISTNKTDAATITVADVNYNGMEQTPSVQVVVNGDTLTQTTNGTDGDYKVAYSNNKNAGKGKVTITYINDYAGRQPETKEFTISPKNINDAVVDFTQDQTFVYNGKKQLPTVKSVKVVLISGTAATTLTEGVDYEVKADTDCTNAGGNQAQIVGKGNYTGIANTKVPFIIEKKVLSDATVSVTTEAVPYKGAYLTEDDIKVHVVDKETGKKLPDTEYTVEYEKDGKYSTFPDNTYLKYGTYGIRISGKAADVSNTNYKAGTSVISSFTIGDKTLAGAKVASAHFKTGYGRPDTTTGLYGTVYTGDKEGQVPDYITIEGYDGKVYNPNCYDTIPADAVKNITAEFPDAKACVNAGTYEIKLTGTDDIKDQTATVKFAITPYTIIDSASEGWTKPIATKAATHTGDESKPYVSMNYKGYQLVEGVDFDMTVDAANKKVAVVGKGNFKTVNPVELDYTDSNYVNMNEPSIQATVSGTHNYTGSAVTLKEGELVVKEVGTNGTYLMKENRDFTVSYVNNMDVGTAYVVLTGIQGEENGKQTGFTGTRKVPFEIVGAAADSVYKLDLTNFKAEYTYNGAAHKPVCANSTNNFNIRKLSNNAIANADVKTVKYLRDGKVTKDFTSTGTITVEVTMKNHSGVLTTSYKIVGKALSDLLVIPEKLENQQYTGEEVKPAITLKATDEGKTYSLKEGRDYEISYVNNVEVGTAHAVVKGIGKYSGSYNVYFNIVGEMDQTIEVLAAQERDLGNGSRTLNSKATKIKYTAETAVTFESSNPDVVTVDAEGNVKYTGLGEATITIKAAAENGYKEATKELKVVVKLAKPSFTPFSKNNAFTLTSSTVKGAEKFEVQYATKKDFSNKKSVKFTATSGKVRQVKVSAADKKTYYVRVRAISGTETSAWSATKTVATK